MKQITDTSASPVNDIPVSIGRWLSGHRNLFKSLPWLTLFIALAGFQFWLGFNYQSNDTTNIYLRLSRGSAWMLLVVLAVLWLPVMRNGLSVLRRSRIGAWLPLERTRAVHRWLGQLLVAASLLHGSQYLIYLFTLDAPFADLLSAEQPDLVRAMNTSMYEFVSEDESIELMADWIAGGSSRQDYESEIRPILKEDCTKCHGAGSTMTYAIPQLPLTSYEDALALSGSGVESRQFRITSSGLMMLPLLLLIQATSLSWVRQRQHHHFQRLHRLGYLIALLALLHIPSLEWIVLPTLVLAVELFLCRHRRLYRGQPARLTAISEQLLRLEIERPLSLPLLPGHYVQIRIPALSESDQPPVQAPATGSDKALRNRHSRRLGKAAGNEWHPFSLTGPREHPQRLVLKIRCHGDWTLALRRRLGQQRECLLNVDIRGPWASPVSQARQRGDWLLIAGGIGITPLLSLMRELQKQQCRQQPPRRLQLVWVLRDPELLRQVRPLLEQLSGTAGLRCHWHLFFTGLDTDTSVQAPPFSPDQPAVRGRPDWSQLIAGIAESGLRPGCYICGPEALTAEAGRACRRMGWPVYKEEF